jgi:hypothetical protein
MTSMDSQNHASGTHGNFEHVGVLLAHMRLQWLLQHFPRAHHGGVRLRDFEVHELDASGTPPWPHVPQRS